MIRSVNLGHVRTGDWTGHFPQSAIDKRPASGSVHAGRLGLSGDQVIDTRHHGGVDKAVYAYAREDLDKWGGELGRTLSNGTFGENLTTSGIDVNEALVGERWRVGTALFEVCSARIPCNTFKGWMGFSGYDADQWVRRFTLRALPGPYLRVIEEGDLAGGDELVVEHRPDHDVTVRTMFRALTTERELLPALLAVKDLTAEARVRAEKYVAEHGG
jgi:MOSC domain-containing protein YiiM